MCTVVDLLQSGTPYIDVGLQRVEIQQLRTRSRRYAQGYLKAGVNVNDGVLVTVADDSELIPLVFGAWTIGARVCLGPATLSTDDVVRKCKMAKITVWVNDMTSKVEGEGKVKVFAPDDLLGQDQEIRSLATADLIALETFTTGTTGNPKCFSFTHSALIGNVEAMARAYGLTRKASILSAHTLRVPGTLTTGLMLPLYLGAKAQISPPHLTSAYRIAERTAPTVIYALPFFYSQLLSRDTNDPMLLPLLNQVDWAFSSSTAIPAAMGESLLERLNVLVRSFYCLSEAGTVTRNDGSDAAAVLSTVGKPLESVAVTTDATNENGVGCLTVTTPFGAKRCSDENGSWELGRMIKTSDLAKIDWNGSIRLMGRNSASVIDVRGQLVNTTEVRDVLLNHPSVQRCGIRVSGASEARSYLVADVWIEAHEGISTAELRNYCSLHLTGLELPRKFNIYRNQQAL